LKYLKFATLGCQDIEIRIFEFVAKTQFLWIEIFHFITVHTFTERNRKLWNKCLLRSFYNLLMIFSKIVQSTFLEIATCKLLNPKWKCKLWRFKYFFKGWKISFTKKSKDNMIPYLLLKKCQMKKYWMM